MNTIIKLDSNENPFGPSPHAIKAMQAVLARCSEYPDDEASTLRLRLAEYHAVKVEQILLAGGLTEFLGMLARAYLAPGLNAVTSERSFIVYRLATEAAGAQLIEVPMRQNGFDLDRVAATVNRNTRIIFLANPNNPTGTMVTADEVDHLLGHVPEQVVVLDEAYHEFAQDFAARGAVTYSRSLDYVRQGRNVVVLRTFSKVHGLAGARVGYGIASKELIARISRQRSMYCVSALAQAGLWPRLKIQHTFARLSKTTPRRRNDCTRRFPGWIMRSLRRGRTFCIARLGGTPGLSPNALKTRGYGYVRWSNGALPTPSA